MGGDTVEAVNLREQPAHQVSAIGMVDTLSPVFMGSGLVSLTVWGNDGAVTVRCSRKFVAREMAERLGIAEGGKIEANGDTCWSGRVMGVHVNISHQTEHEHDPAPH